MSRQPVAFAIAVAVLGMAHYATADEIRDPTRPPMREARTIETGEPTPVLSAVMSFNGKRKAIFNGQVVTDGSKVGDYTIDAVLEDGVRYRRANVTHELHLAPPATTIKKPAAEPSRAPTGVQQ